MVLTNKRVGFDVNLEPLNPEPGNGCTALLCICVFVAFSQDHIDWGISITIFYHEMLYF
jgi:hypothetical protein